MMTMAVCDQCEKEDKQLYYYSPDNTTMWLCRSCHPELMNSSQRM
jgi:hypothetical protein